LGDSDVRKSQKKIVIIPSESRFIREAVEALLDFMKNEVSATDKDELAMVLSEALANAIIHGNRMDASKQVVSQAEIKNDRLILKIVDEGSGFNFKELPNPLTSENVLKRHGRGLFLIRKLMDEVFFNPAGNEITMVKKIRPASRVHEPPSGQYLDAETRCVGELRQIYKSDLRFGDIVGVATVNSVYLIAVLNADVYVVSGGWFDRNGLSPKRTAINGCTWGGTAIKQDLVAAEGLCVEFGDGVVTSPVQRFKVFRAGRAACSKDSSSSELDNLMKFNAGHFDDIGQLRES
jgi:serine/threonine-protein kinase RsbW